MPTEMSEEELETSLASATEVDTFEFGEFGEDDYFTATLYKTGDGRHFRHIGSTGMAAAVTSNTGEWLTNKEAKSWNEF